MLGGGEIVELVWAALLARAGGRPPSGPQGDTTDDPDLHLVVNGARLDPPAVDGTTYRFTLSAPPSGPLALRSRTGVPSLLGITAHDHRRLGVAISRIVYGQRGVTTTLLFNAPVLQQGGCHPPEAGFCWADGDIELPARLFAHLRGPFTLTVHTERPGGMRYPLAGEVARAA